MPVEFTVVGEALIDLVQSADAPRTFTAHAGGSPYNVAVTLARLGADVSLAARCGTDAFGALLEAKAARSGVRFDRWERVPEPTSLAVASVDEDGRASYDFYFDHTAGLGWDATLLDAAPTSGVLHLGSVASWRGPSNSVVHALQQRAYDAGDVLVSYDPNVRPVLMPDRELARSTVERSLAAAHVVKASDEDLGFLYPDRTIAEVAASWCGLGALLVVVTRGGKGAVAFTADGELARRPAVPIVLADTVGAGDSFTGGLLAGLAEHGITSPDALRSGLGDGAVAAAIDQAVLVSAMTCERPGADPPTRAELGARRGS